MKNYKIMALPKGNFINYIAVELTEHPAFYSSNAKLLNRIINVSNSKNRNLNTWSKQITNVVRNLNLNNYNKEDLLYYRNLVNRYRTLRNVTPRNTRKKYTTTRKSPKKTLMNRLFRRG